MTIPKALDYQAASVGSTKGFLNKQWETRLEGSTDAVRKAAAFVWPRLHDPELLGMEGGLFKHDNFFKLLKEARTHAGFELGNEGAADFLAWYFDVWRTFKNHPFKRLVEDSWGKAGLTWGRFSVCLDILL